jgi:hypothetical protein
MRGQSFEYELAFDGDTGADAPHLVGLIDADELGEPATTTASSRGAAPQFAAPSRGQNAPISAPSRASPSAAEQALAQLASDEADEEPQTHALRPNGKHPSYVVTPSLAAEVRQ